MSLIMDWPGSCHSANRDRRNHATEIEPPDTVRAIIGGMEGIWTAAGCPQCQTLTGRGLSVGSGLISINKMAQSIPPKWLLPVLCSAFFTTVPGFSAQAAVPDTASFLKQRNAAGLHSALSEHLRGVEKSGDVEALFSDEGYRRLLAAHEVLRVTGDKSVSALLSRYPDFSAFLTTFLGDREWMEAYLAAGKPPTNTEFGLETLYKIWKADGLSPDFGSYKQLSAAIGVTWGMEGKRADNLRAAATQKPFNIDPVWRFKFYKTGHKTGRMHPMFGRLKSWELRYVVEKAWDDASLAWSNENINVPLQYYVDACWAVRYRGENDFGDTIQGPLFYKPWDNLMNQSENTKVHGGVCGSLSTFGATAASAHGIPSYTCGQPAHCAYAVRFARGDWRGGFGGPDGSPHTAIWPGNIHFVNLMEIVFGNDLMQKRALAHGARAQLLMDAGDLPGAQKAIAAALATSPMHLDLRRDEIAILEKSGKMTSADWLRHAETLLSVFGEHSDPALSLISGFEYRFLNGADDAAKLDWYAKYHAASARATGSFARADDVVEKLLPKQADTLKSEDSRESLLRLALAAYLGSPDGACFGKVLEWGVKSFVDKGKSDAFGRAFAASANGTKVKFDEKKLREFYEKAILAACAAKSVPVFQTLGKAASRFAKKVPGPDKLDLPPGKLVSSEGMLRPSTKEWCSAVDFYNVLNETGGIVHTNSESSPSVIVELPRTVEVSGILVVKTNGYEERMKKARVSYSMDGATWFPIEETPSMPKQWRIIPSASTQARWIKVEALNDKPEVMHFRNILVFSKE